MRRSYGLQMPGGGSQMVGLGDGGVSRPCDAISRSSRWPVKDLFLALRDRTRCTAFRVQNRMSPEAPGRSRTVPSGLRTTRRGTTRPPRTTKANSSPL